MKKERCPIEGQTTLGMIVGMSDVIVPAIREISRPKNHFKMVSPEEMPEEMTTDRLNNHKMAFLNENMFNCVRGNLIRAKIRRFDKLSNEELASHLFVLEDTSVYDSGIREEHFINGRIVVVSKNEGGYWDEWIYVSNFTNDKNKRSQGFRYCGFFKDGEEQPKKRLYVGVFIFPVKMGEAIPVRVSETPKNEIISGLRKNDGGYMEKSIVCFK